MIEGTDVSLPSISVSVSLCMSLFCLSISLSVYLLLRASVFVSVSVCLFLPTIRRPVSLSSSLSPSSLSPTLLLEVKNTVTKEVSESTIMSP